MSTYKSPTQFRLLIPAQENTSCGYADPGYEHGYVERLKLEVAVGVGYFWAKRGLPEPQSDFKYLDGFGGRVA